MTPERAEAIVSKLESATDEVFVFTRAKVTGIDSAIDTDLARLREEVTLEVSLSGARLTRTIALVISDAEFHLLRAYFHASPSLWSLLVAIYEFVQVVIDIIKIINEVLKVVTGNNLIYWVDQLMPGFQRAWDDIMNKISEFSASLGWGVDGVMHLLSIANTATNVWGSVTGKSSDWYNTEKVEKMRVGMSSFKVTLKKWQDNPGAMIDWLLSYETGMGYRYGSLFINQLVEKADTALGKVEELFTGVGSINDEMLDLRNGMPQFIFEHIPQALWDGLEWTDTVINDAILPAINKIDKRLGALDTLLDEYKKKADLLADKIAHPGDMLAEINALPGYVRDAQLVKIDSVTSQLLKKSNDADFAALEGDLREFGLVAAALSQPPAPLSFMELELPGRSPGIVAEPRETWFVGDY